MAIIGSHMLFYSSEPEALRSTLRDVFNFPSVDAGGGWPIFALPPSEIAVHPSEGPNDEAGMRHEISFMCDDLHATVADLRAKGIEFEGEPEDRRYGILTTMKLPGGVRAILYQPRHQVAIGLPS